jgi:acetylornithine aminotransferase
MIGIEFPTPVKEIRARLLNEFHIFTGFSGTNTIRLLPPLTLGMQEAIRFIESFREAIQQG